jgi:hypothetical protein
VSDEHDELWPYRALAAAVIRQAVVDAHSKYVPSGARAMALSWLRHSADLVWWCHVAGLNPHHVRHLATATNSGPLNDP